MSDYTIQDVIEQTGLPRRTIYFYTQQGILPPPQGAGLSARYQRIHLLRVKLIPFLRKQGQRLDQIREYFDEQTESALENRLKEEQSLPLEPIASPAPNPPPARFIHYVLPKGMTLVVPAEIVANGSARIDEIVRTIQKKMQE
jgi:DNA-binding transcriptional MerR regulator